MMLNNRTIYKTVLLVGLIGGMFTQSCYAQTSGNTAKNLFELTPQASPVTDQTVQVSSEGLIDLDLRDQDITQVLNLLSLQSQRNIIVSPNVTGTISGRIYGADLYEVLDGILTPYGLTYRESGNFIHVYTNEEIKETQQTTQKLVSKIVRLNYISADEANTFLTPLLSDAGIITASIKAEVGFEAQESDGGANGYAHAEILIIRDIKENVEAILTILAELDKRPQQVLIEATILRATLTEENQMGVDLTAVADMVLQEATSPVSVINDLVTKKITGSATAFQTSFAASSNITTSGGTQIGIVRDGIGAFIRALDRVTDTTIVANPKLLVLNRQRAVVQDTIDQAILTTKTVNQTTTNSVQSVPSGTFLRIRPFISSDDFIRMELKPEISTGTRVDLGTTQGIDKDQQSMITNVLVRNGNTVILGGLIREENKVSRSQTPFLGDVPLLGSAFRSQGDTVKRTETIFLVTPTIVRDDSLYAKGEKMKDNIRTAQFGSRQGLLPFSRTKMVSDHMRNATRYYKAGKMRYALLSIEMALRLDPNYHQARQLKARIIKRTNQPAEHFFLDEYSDKLIQKHLKESEKVIDLGVMENFTPQKTIPTVPTQQTSAQTASVPVQ